MDRRGFLLVAGGALAATAAGSGSAGAGPRARLRIGQLAWGGEPLRLNALRRLAWEIEKRTSIEVAEAPVELHLGDAALFRSPFLYLSGGTAPPMPTEDEVGRLRRHLDLGGFLLADATCGCSGGDFERGVRALLGRVYPRTSLVPLPREHVLWKSFYLLDSAPGRTSTAPPLVLIRDQRVVAVLSSNDLGGAWSRDSFGRWEHEVVPGGQGQRELAFRFGVNLVMYAMCLDYKDDQVHVPFILKRRRWRSE